MGERMVDAVVIGGGIVGMSTAYNLVCAGAETVLIDRADAGRATDAGAGILSPETNTRDPDIWFDLAVDAVEYYPTLIEGLRAEQAGDVGYSQCGALVVAMADDALGEFEATERRIIDRRDRRGVPSPDRLHATSPAEAVDLMPPLGDVAAAIWNANARRVDGRLLNTALRVAAEHHGLTIIDGSVDELIFEGTRVTGVRFAGEDVLAGATAIAGGAWSSEFGRQIGMDLPIQPQRGQIIHIDLPGTDTSAWPIISAFGSQYMVPWPDGRIVVGASRETGSGFAKEPTVAGVHEVLAEALRVAPGLGPGRIREIRVGLRPVTSDSMPVLGDVPGVSGLYLVTGHGPTGLTLGPYSGHLVAQLMLGSEPSSDISAFHASRFSV
jgi:D-amino-acid dehydrogenase